jgi:hypothetical protein
MISKMDERRGGRMSATKKERFGKSHRQGLESIWAEIMEFRRTGSYDLMDVKRNELNWKKPLGFDTEDCQSRSETCVENLGYLYYRAVRST